MSVAAPQAVVVTSGKAGFLVRAVALIVDTVLLTIVSAVLNGILSSGAAGPGSGLQLLIGIAYYVYFWSDQGKGQTLGMRALKIRVVRTDGAPLSIGGALIRYVGLVISCLAFFIGVLWVLWDAHKQGWHDKLASTYVVRA